MTSNNYKVVDMKEVNGFLVITLGSDDPFKLARDSAIFFSKKIAERKGYNRVYKVHNVKTRGQNNLSLRKFVFIK